MRSKTFSVSSFRWICTDMPDFGLRNGWNV